MGPYASDPAVSVVIASKVGAPFVDRCLESVQRAAATAQAEIIVVSGRRSEVERLEAAFPAVRVVWHERGQTIPELRCRGVVEARGEIVAIIEEHCRADPNWVAEARQAHARGTYGAVGGPIADDDYRRLRDWVVYFCEYNGFLPPAPSGDVEALNGANIAYRRRVLLDHHELLTRGYWEAALHPSLLRRGVRFRSAPGMIVRHCGPFDLRYYLRQRYWFSRAYADARARSLPFSQRAAYLLLAPLLPAALYGRIARRVWEKRCHPVRFLFATPLVLLALVVLVAGEWVGYLAGPGDALSKVE